MAPAPSTSGTDETYTNGRKTSLQPRAIEVPSTSSGRVSHDAPMSPRSWRARQTFQQPSRKHTAASLDAEDYFVRSSDNYKC